MSQRPPDPGYVASRRVLLDALEAIGAHRDALILVGAQAVYLRTQESNLIVAPYTQDADLVINPAELAAAPPLQRLLREAGFLPAGAGLVGRWLRVISVAGRDQSVPVDLLVPEGVVKEGGRRTVQLPGHDGRVARRTLGLEAALVDNDRQIIRSLDAADSRSAELRVAGAGALLVAKLHKISERLEDKNPDRARDKDAGDVYRLFQSTSPLAMATALRVTLADPVSSRVTEVAMSQLPRLFGRPAGVGILMAIRSLTTGGEAGDTIEAVAVGYVRELAIAMRA